MDLYTECSDCGTLVIVDAEARDSELVRCRMCGFQEEARVLRKPFRSQLDEGPLLPARFITKPPEGYANA